MDSTFFVGQKFGWSSTYQLIGFIKVTALPLVSLLLLAATKGTVISPYITSQIVERTEAKTALVFGGGC